MARPLQSASEPARAKPDVIGEVLRTVLTMDRRQVDQGSAMLHLANEIGELRARVGDMNRRLDEVLALLRDALGTHRSVDPMGSTMRAATNGNGEHP
jgi:hypothetical protein